MEKSQSSWYYNSKVFTDDDIPKNAYGFIYAIKITLNERQRTYVGKKNFYSNRRVKKGKKELAAMDDKRGSKHKIVKKLDYEKYCSSNKAIKDAVKQGIKIKKYILKICYSKMELTYQETRYLFKLDVLEDDKYLNDNILGRFYRSKIQNKDE
jgi:hypothetical protein